MKTTWHFKIPETLLLPATHRLAAQQGLSALSAENTEGLLLLFQTFSAYANLPLGLNPQRRRALRIELQQLKSDPNSTLADVGFLIKKIKETKERYHFRKQIAETNNLSVFSTYESDDLLFIAEKILKPISSYLRQASKELSNKQIPRQVSHPLTIYKNFIEKIRIKLQKHQQTIAKNMLLRLSAADSHNNLSYDDVIQDYNTTFELGNPSQNLSRKHFFAFHAYIEKYGSRNTRLSLRRLSWIESGISPLKNIIHPNKPKRPTWLFLGRFIIHRSFGDPYHQARMLLQIKKLNSIGATDPTQLATASKIQQSLASESQRLTVLSRKLFPWIHRKSRHQLQTRLRQLDAQQQKTTFLVQSIEQKIEALNFEHIQKQKKRAALIRKVQRYDAETAEQFFLQWAVGSGNIITLDGIHYKTDWATIKRMRSALSSLKRLQHTLLLKIQSIVPENIPALNATIEILGTADTKALWYTHIDLYRLQCFKQCVLDAENSITLAKTFDNALQQITLPFPYTEGVAMQLTHLVKQLPLTNWTEEQHHACESIESNPILSEYYGQAIQYCLSCEVITQPEFTDAIIQRFSKEYLLEIEFPELRKNFDRLIQRRLAEKKSGVTAALIQSELEQGQVDAALSRLQRLEQDLLSAKTTSHQEIARKQLLLVTSHLTETSSDPRPLSQKLILTLRRLLQSTEKDHSYLEQISQLKLKAEQLPYSQKYIAIKRLCNAGPQITFILNQLPSSIMAFANAEVELIPEINPILLNIIEFDLIEPKQKQLLEQLIDASLLNDHRLPENETNRLKALRRCLNGTISDKDRTAFLATNSPNPHRFTFRHTQSTRDSQGGSTYATTVRHT